MAGQEDKSIDLYLSGRVNKSNLRRAGGGKMFSNLSRAAATMSVGSKAAIFFSKVKINIYRNHEHVTKTAFSIQ